MRLKTPAKFWQPLFALIIFAGLQRLAAQNSAAVLRNDQIAANEAALEAWDDPSQPVGPNHRTTFRNTPTGQHQIVELMTGMNYWDGHEWRTSDPSFVADQDGFLAEKTQHRVHLAADLNVADAVTVITPEGIDLNSSPVGVALYDTASGNFSVIATITNCAGQLAASNQVIYPDAFSGGVCADVVYTITAGAFHQDVVFTGSLNPEDYGFPAATTRIQILTEFLGAHIPDVRVRPLYVETDPQLRQSLVSPDLIDQQLGFGRFVMNQGKAYVAPSTEITNGLEALVAKEYVTVGDANYLIESVPYASIAPALQALPPCHPSLNGLQPKVSKGFAKLPRLWKRYADRTPPHHQSPARLAGVKAWNYPEHGLVVDYVASISGTMNGTNVFRGDTTYLVSGAVTCSGTAVIEGGTVFKYKSSTYAPSITLNGGLTCDTSMYRPAIFTAVDDNTVGDSMNGVSNSGYTGIISTNYYAYPALSVPNLNFNGFRFSYAKTAVEVNVSAAGTATFSHSQFVHCRTAIFTTDTTIPGEETMDLELYNCLFSTVSIPFQCTNNSSGKKLLTVAFLYNTTIDNVTQLTSVGGSGVADYNVNGYNSIFSNIGTNGSVALSGTNNGFFNNGGGSFGSSPYVVYTSPFQTVGAGSYYLTSASGFQSYGITNGLPASLIYALGQRTTYPPLVTMQTTQTTSLVIVPQALRDIAVQSLGYHYDPLDRAFGGVYFTGSSISVSNGAAVATFGTNASSFGLGIGSGCSFSSVGAPSLPNWITLYNMVMEGTNNWSRPTNSVTGELYGANPAPTIYTRFTFWSVPVQDAPQFYAPGNTGPISFQDSEFHGGPLISDGPTINLTNCLLERVYAKLASTDGNSPWIQNCLFRGGTFNFAPNVSTATVVDNLFDATSISNNSALYATYYGGYNGYVTNYSRLLPFSGGDRILTASPAYQSSFLGTYYLPPNSPLIRAGSTTANNLGLYEYTTQTNQVEETNSVVDIGYHYVATDQNGNPLDTLWEGIPDYLADTNGSGGLASWEMEYFGQLGLNPNASYDGQGNTLLYDYLSGIVPNGIQFYLESTNDYVNGTTVTLQVNVTSGLPRYYAVFVNESATTNWISFVSTNLTVNIGPTDGVYDVIVGLSGSPNDPQPFWADYKFTLDRVPPALTITNPILSNAAATVVKPYLQLQGFANEQLTSLSYDLSNALGQVTFQPASVTSQYLDTNLFDLTTNFFQAYDVPLSTGPNQIVFRATDRAGNTTTTNFTVTLNYASATNPPVVQLIWPQNNMAVSGTCITIRGKMSDETGTILAQTTDGSGNPVTVQGLVERNNMFWIEGVPLTGATQTITLQATDAATNETVTTFTVLPAGTTLTIDTTPTDSALYRLFGAVSGTVSDPNATVMINGSNATVDSVENDEGSYDWNAPSVPIYGIGTATFDAVAYSAANSAEANVSQAVTMPAEEMITAYFVNQNTRLISLSGGPFLYAFDNIYKTYSAGLGQGANNSWTQSYNGTVDNEFSLDWWPDYLILSGTWSDTQSSFTTTTVTSAGPTSPEPYNPSWSPALTQIPDSDGIEDTGFYVTHYYASGVTFQYQDTIDESILEESLNARTTLTLYTGGKSTVSQQSLFDLYVDPTAAYEYPPDPEGAEWFDAWDGAAILTMDVTSLQCMGTSPGADGNIWKALPDNSVQDVTVTAPGRKHYCAYVSPGKYRLYVGANNSPLQPNHVVGSGTFCVGQYINFSPLWRPAIPPYVNAIAVWTLPPTFVNEQPYAYCPAFYDENPLLLHDILSVNGTLSTFCWYVQAVQAQSASLSLVMFFPNGQQVAISRSGEFNVYRPTFATPLQIISTGLNTVYAGPAGTALGFEPGASPGVSGSPVAYVCYENSIFSGTGQITQLINGSAPGSVGNITTGGATDLDFAYPYPYEGPVHVAATSPGGPHTVSPIVFDDSPWVTCGNSPTIINWAFTDYLQFRPDAGNPLQNIFVTLGIITWNDYGKANDVNGVWSIDPSSTVATPSGPVNSIVFPCWTNTVSISYW